jgi:ribosome biogenesis protein UTP30
LRPAPLLAAGEGHKAAKARAREERSTGIAKVVGLSKLRSKYESHEAKRQLCGSYDLFVADERVLPSLPKLLGAAGWGGGMGRAAAGRNTAV